MEKTPAPENCPPRTPKDWASGARGLLIWGVPVAILMLGSFLPVRYLVILWPIVLTFMGVACLLNARSCGRLHCYFTGPFLLAMAAAALLYGLGVLPLGRHGWNTLSLILLAGGIGLGCGPELFFGRYRQRSAARPADHRW